MLQNCRILIVEDEPVVALALVAILEDEGAEIVSVVQTVAAALDVVRQNRVNCALLDIHLHGETSYLVADVLSECRMPFAFLTGYVEPAVPRRHLHRPIINKPFFPMEVLEVLATLPRR